MGPDEALERLLDAVEQNNYQEVKSYCEIILKNLHHVDSARQKELKEYITSLQSAAQKEETDEVEKQDLINQILSSNKDTKKYNLK
jgi:uncharacterized protein with von Willebrand factor type A (vWA) domain